MKQHFGHISKWLSAGVLFGVGLCAVIFLFDRYVMDPEQSERDIDQTTVGQEIFQCNVKGSGTKYIRLEVSFELTSSKHEGYFWIDNRDKTRDQILRILVDKNEAFFDSGTAALDELAAEIKEELNKDFPEGPAISQVLFSEFLRQY